MPRPLFTALAVVLALGASACDAEETDPDALAVGEAELRVDGAAPVRQEGGAVYATDPTGEVPAVQYQFSTVAPDAGGIELELGPGDASVGFVAVADAPAPGRFAVTSFEDRDLLDPLTEADRGMWFGFVFTETAFYLATEGEVVVTDNADGVVEGTFRVTATGYDLLAEEPLPDLAPVSVTGRFRAERLRGAGGFAPGVRLL